MEGMEETLVQSFFDKPYWPALALARACWQEPEPLTGPKKSQVIFFMALHGSVSFDKRPWHALARQVHDSSIPRRNRNSHGRWQEFRKQGR